MIVEAVLREVRRPLCSVGGKVFLRRGRAIGVQDLTDHPLVVEGVELPQGARRAGGRRVSCARAFEKGKLSSITEKAKAAPLTVDWKRRLKRTRQRQLAVGCRARAGQARRRRGGAALPLHVGLLHRRGEVHVFAQSAVLVSNFRAQIVIDVANFAKTENGHETGPQGTDSSLDPTFGNDFSKRIRFRPPRDPGRPKSPRKISQILQISQNFQIDYNLRGIY